MRGRERPHGWIRRRTKAEDDIVVIFLASVDPRRLDQAPALEHARKEAPNGMRIHKGLLKRSLPSQYFMKSAAR
jgi:hypothetical protein